MKKQAIIYTFGSVLLQAINFLLLPLYANQFTVDEFGKLSIIQISGMVISWFLGLQITSSLIRYYYDYDTTERIKLIKSGYGFSIIFNLFFGIIFILIIQIPFFAKHSMSQLYLAMFFSQFMFFFSNLNSSILRIEKKAYKFIILQIIQAIVIFSFTIFFVVFLKKGIISVFYGKIIGALTACLIYFIFWKNWNYLSLRFDFNIIKKLLKFSIYLIPSSLAFWIINSSDHYFIKYMLGDEQLGIYAYSYKFALIISFLLVIPLTKAWAPYAYSNIDNTSLIKNRLNQMITIFIAIAFLVLIPLSLFIEDFMKLFAKPEYLKGTKIIFSIGLSYIAFGISAFTGTGFHIIKNTKILPKITAYSAITNLFLNFILIKYLGLIGAVIATLFAYSMKSFLNIKILQKVFYIKYDYKIWFQLSIISVLFYITANIISTFIDSLILLNLIKLIIYILFIYIIWKIIKTNKEIEKLIKSSISTIFYHFFSLGYIYSYNTTSIPQKNKISNNFKIKIITLEDKDLLKEFSKYHNQGHYKKNIYPRISQPDNFIGIACIDLTRSQIAYLAWIALKGKIKTFRYYYHTVTENSAFLFDDYTVPQYRRNGLHKRIMEERIRYCLDKNIDEINIAIASNNPNALSNMRKFNFKKKTRILILKKFRKIWKKNYEK